MKTINKTATETSTSNPKGTTMKKIDVLPELSGLFDVLTDTEFAELEKSIKADGVRDPIVLWKEKNAIIDGHHRFKLAEKLKIDAPTVEKSFKDIDAVKEWMLRNQLGRRNLTPARFDYFIGKLYNQLKRTVEYGTGDAATKLAEQFGTSEKTVRRAGDVAVGLDRIAEIKGEVAKKAQLIGNKAEQKYTKEELTSVAKVTPAAAKILVAKIDTAKVEKAQAAAAAKVAKPSAPKPAPAPKEKTYPVVFAQPGFDGIGYSLASQKKPPLEANAVVYMAVEDGFLMEAMDLIDKWGLTYECTFIYKTPPVDGVWSKVQHTFMIVGTTGTITGPDAGKEAPSLPNGPDAEGVDAKMAKLINSYHPKAEKLALLSSFKTPQGWSVLSSQ